MWRRWFIVSIGAVGSVALLWNLARTGSELFYERRELDRAAERVEEMRGRIAGLETERERLKKDHAYIESIARDDLGMVRPGEIVYYFPQNP